MVRAAATTRSGRRIYVDPEDPRALELVRAQGDLNPLSLRLWQRVLLAHEWELVVDVGVNYGEMLVGPELPPRAEVVGLEPNLALHPYLRRTLAEAGLGRARLLGAAVAGAPGRARFAVDTSWSGTSSLSDAAAASPTSDDPGRWRYVEVPVTTLEDVVGPAERSFCVKVDVEGLEHEVVAGAGSLLTRPGPWVLMLEALHLDPAYLRELAAAYDVLVSRRDGSLRLLEPGAVEATLADAEVYAQDCLVVSPGLVDALLDGLV